MQSDAQALFFHCTVDRDYNRTTMLSVWVLLTSSLVTVCVGTVRDPYSRIEAEWFDFNQGVLVHNDTGDSGGQSVGFINPGDVLGYHRLNFSEETVGVRLRVSCNRDPDPRRRFLLHLHSPQAQPFLTHTMDSTRLWTHYLTVTLLFEAGQTRPRGVQDLYFTFTETEEQRGVGRMDWFTFIPLHTLLLPPSRTAARMDSCPQCPTTQHHVSNDHCHHANDSNKNVNIYIY